VKISLRGRNGAELKHQSETKQGLGTQKSGFRFLRQYGARTEELGSLSTQAHEDLKAPTERIVRLGL